MRHIQALLIATLSLGFVGCSQSGPVYDMKTERGFFDGTFAVRRNLTREGVIALIGRPEHVYPQGDDWNVNKRLGTTEAWSYYRPGFATLHFVVGFDRDKVAKTCIWEAMCTAGGDGHLDSVHLYWSGIDYDVRTRDGFRAASSVAIKDGEQVDVIRLFGFPDRVDRAGNPDIGSVPGEDEAWIYVHPDNPSVQWIIGFAGRRVISSRMKESSPSGARYSDTQEYWRKVDG